MVVATDPVPDAVTGPVRAVIPPPLIEAQPVALPLASMPVGALPVPQSVGVTERALAVAALPVVAFDIVPSNANVVGVRQFDAVVLVAYTVQGVPEDGKLAPPPEGVAAV